MIQATELRIGNWVEEVFAGGRGQKQVNWLMLQDMCKETPMFIYEPIPLSPDILEKCGFVMDTIENPFFSGYSIKLPRKREISVSCPGTPNEMVFINDHYKEERQIVVARNLDYDGKTYLHQLQNLYFALTGEELTLNL